MFFNLVGYRWLFSAMEQNATAKLDEKIDAGHYTSDQLVEIRIPLNMPYYADKDFENVSGEMDWNGNHYRYVKRKISGNTIYLYCLPHIEKTNLENAESDFTKSANNVPGNHAGSQQKSNLIKLITTEFNESRSLAAEASFEIATANFICSNDSAKNLFTPPTDGQPPEYFLVC